MATCEIVHLYFPVLLTQTLIRIYYAILGKFVVNVSERCVFVTSKGEGMGGLEKITNAFLFFLKRDVELVERSLNLCCINIRLKKMQ